MSASKRTAFGPAPTSIVADGKYSIGRYSTLFAETGMLGVEKPFHYRLPDFIKNFRLKEWQTLQFGDQRWFFSCTVYNAKFLTFVDFHALDRESKQCYAARKLLVGGGIRMPRSLVAGSVRYSSRQCRLVISTSLLPDGEGGHKGKVGIEIGVAARRRDSGFEGSFELAFDSDRSTPNVVCLPLGLNRAMYSAKSLMPMTGWFRHERVRTDFSGPGSFGMFDDNKGYYPWSLRSDRVSGFGTDRDGHRVGFNLCDNQVRDQSRYNENCLWIDGELWPLPPVKVTRPNGPAGEWIIQDMEGLVDLVFMPEVPNDIKIRALVVETDYHGPCGSYKGEIRNGAGFRVDASVFFGTGEQVYLRI